VKAAKWWIGDLGIFCTHACVFAQLIIKGKNHGVHAFLVPIRDKNHKPFPGLEVGDIGPKMGFQTKDNGYLIMKNYRIPRKWMLMKYHKVSKDGTYTVSGNEKISYATMLVIRSTIPFISFVKTSKAITILTRYSLSRRQFKDNKGVEMPILDYQLQQEKIFPRIAETFATLFSFKNIYGLSKAILQDASNNNFERLQEGHIIASSIKALTTKDGLRGLELLRRAGGGHGYSSYSGIPGLQN
jgi:acyl-CoA oxidase